MGGYTCGSVSFITHVSYITNVRSAFLLVNILWSFDKCSLFDCDHISDYPVVVI